MFVQIVGFFYQDDLTSRMSPYVGPPYDSTHTLLHILHVDSITLIYLTIMFIVDGHTIACDGRGK